MNLMDMAYVNYMAEAEGLLPTRTGKLNAIANELRNIYDPTNDDLERIMIKYGITELTADEMKYIGSRV